MKDSRQNTPFPNGESSTQSDFLAEIPAGSRTGDPLEEAYKLLELSRIEWEGGKVIELTEDSGACR